MGNGFGSRRVSRRAFLLGTAGGAALLRLPAICSPEQDLSDSPWWHATPTFIQTNDADLVFGSSARVVLHGFGADPTWGPYGQALRNAESRESLNELRSAGMRVLAYIEGFGDCMLYAAALNRLPDGTYEAVQDVPGLAAVVRNHWNWASPEAPQGNVLCWIGIHNAVAGEPFARLPQERSRLAIPIPRYPDGRPATGRLAGKPYLLSARVYDACAAKDVNGRIEPQFEPTAGVNGPEPAGGWPAHLTDGLLAATPGIDDVTAPTGHPAGRPVLCGVVNIHKDLSAPFWRECVRATARVLVRNGVDGVWCDNFSPWDNFGYPPVRKAFGDWSVHRFRNEYLARLTSTQRARLGIPGKAESLDIRAAFRARAAKMGAADPTSLTDPAWCDRRWLDDPLWRAYRAFRQQAGRADLRMFYEAIHEEAKLNSTPGFCVQGNDIPLYSLGWARDGWLDMVSTEVTPGWHMGTGSRGIGVPPVGKMAVVYRAAREHQKGPFSAAWYYLDDPKLQRKPGLGKVLEAEALANGAVLLCDPAQARVAGTVESHAWINRFVNKNIHGLAERTPVADIAVLLSPDNQLYQLAPGGFPNIEDQPHMFGHWGWATALVDGHLPYRVVTDWKVTTSLAGIRALVAPHAECLSSAAMNAIEAWVRRGGTLIATGEMGARYGTDGAFERRSTSWFRRLASTGAATVSLGKGRVKRISGNPGADYFLLAADRPNLLGTMLADIGASTVLDGSRLPTTVGISCWRARTGAVQVDLVNYGIDTATDAVRPAGPLTFRVRIPGAWPGATARVLSPDPCAAKLVGRATGWAEVRVESLPIYAIVEITRAEG